MVNDLIEQAARARTYWIENRLETYDLVLLLPQNDHFRNEIMMGTLERKLEALVATGEGRPLKAAVLSVGSPSGGKYFTGRRISEEVAASLVTLYSMYEFTDRLIIGSFDLPHGRKLKNLLGCGIASGSELADAVIFSDIR